METPSRSRALTEPTSSIWEREEPGPRAPLTPLRRDQVVAAAVGLADTEGLAAVSVRGVAAALGVGPMRLYRVFASIDELHELMLDEVYGEIVATIHPRGDWRARVRAVVTRTRDGFLAHEWVAELVGIRPHLGPSGLAHLELMADALRRAPAVSGPDSAWAAMGAVSGFLVGAVRRDVADRRTGRTDDGVLEWQARMAPYMSRMLQTGRFPALLDLVVGRGHPNPDTAFRRELDVLLAGLAAPEVSRRAR